MTVEDALWLQPSNLTYVRSPVDMMKSELNDMHQVARKRFVKVAPPTVHAGVGNALRQAYRIDTETRSLGAFEDLLRQLD